MKINVSPQTRSALRALVAKGLEQLITTGTAEPILVARRNARGLEVTSSDGRMFSGVLILHRNVVSTGVVVEDNAIAADTIALAAGTHELGLDLRNAVGIARKS